VRSELRNEKCEVGGFTTLPKLLLFFFFLFSFSSSSYAGIITIQRNGATFESVQAALNSAEADDVLLCEGSFGVNNVS